MSSLVLIRHGQASFGAADYDVLSELGAAQSRKLGSHFANGKEPFDAIYSGPRRRHLGTTKHMCEAAHAEGMPSPKPTVIDELDELPAFELVAHWRPIIEAREPGLAKRIVSGSARAMATILDRWADGSLDSGDHETYAAFSSRVTNAIDRIRDEQGSKKRVAVVTSGGPIAITVGQSLELRPTKAMSILWSLANSSVTEFHYRPGELGLTALNRIAHLDSLHLVTTR